MQVGILLYIFPIGESAGKTGKAGCIVEQGNHKLVPTSPHFEYLNTCQSRKLVYTNIRNLQSGDLPINFYPREIQGSVSGRECSSVWRPTLVASPLPHENERQLLILQLRASSHARAASNLWWLYLLERTPPSSGKTLAETGWASFEQLLPSR